MAHRTEALRASPSNAVPGRPRGLVAISFLLVTLGATGAMAQSDVTSRGVPYDRLVRAAETPEDWLTYNGDYAGRRFSPLDQINTSNVGTLRAEWAYQTDAGLVETSPVVFDGLMLLTEPPSTVTALDVRTGKRIWKFEPKIPATTKTLGFPPVNRGVAALDDLVFVGTTDAWLYALDLETGAERWRTQVADNDTGHAITLAPLALDGKVIVGISGGEAGIRGFVDAYDAKSGERVWRFYTIPAPGEPGNETWGGDSWKTGAGATWITGSYDPELDLLYWGVGNPGPDWNGDVRPGDNLYTSSVVALRAGDGTLAWHFQYTPHDTHDWDANQVPVLVDLDLAGQPTKTLVTANRNAFYYVLERRGGQFLRAEPYAKQTWAERIDEAGRPVVLPNTEPTEEGVLVWPSLQGATNWYSPSYSPRTELFYVATREMGAVYYKTDVEYEPGEYFTGGGEQALDGEDARGFVRALEVRTGELAWEWPMLTPPWAGVLSTGGDLVFGGTNEGQFFALDAKSGKPLWNFQTGGAVRANPIAYAVDGRQFVAISGGTTLFTFALPD